MPFPANPSQIPPTFFLPRKFEKKNEKNHPNYRSFDERQEGKKLFFNEFEG